MFCLEYRFDLELHEIAGINLDLSTPLSRCSFHTHSGSFASGALRGIPHDSMIAWICSQTARNSWIAKRREVLSDEEPFDSEQLP
jgi:hypothetical protein